MDVLTITAINMLTQIIDGVNPLPIDSKILATIRDEGYNPHPGNTRCLAILNAEGKLYRIIGCTTPGDTARAAGRLYALGLINRIRFDDSILREVDVLTGRPINTAWSGVFQLGNKPHPIPSIPKLDLQGVRFPTSGNLFTEFEVTRRPKPGEIFIAANGVKFRVYEVITAEQINNGFDEPDVPADYFIAIILEGNKSDLFNGSSKVHELDPADFAEFCSNHGIVMP